MNVTKATLHDLIRDELEKLKKEMSSDWQACLAGIDISDDGEDRLRPELPILGQDDDLAEDGRSKPRKSHAQKAKSQQRAKRREDEEKKRARVFGGEALFNQLGLSEDELEEDKAKKDDYQTKRTGKYKQCKGKGSQYHSKSGQFSSKEDAASNSLYFSCDEYPFRTRKGMKALTDPKDSGRGKSKTSGKGRYRMYDDAKLFEHGKAPSMKRLNENWQRFLSEHNGEGQGDKSYELDKGQKIDANKLKASLKKEISKLLQAYGKQLSVRQKHAIHNTEELSDAKLATYCDSFGMTSIMSWLDKTDGIDVAVRNIVQQQDEQFYKPTTQQQTMQDTNIEGGQGSPGSPSPSDA